LQAFSGSPWQAPESQALFRNRLEGVASVGRQEANLNTLRGMLALEAGAIESAQRAFRDAVAAWNGDGGPATLARHYLELIGP